MVSVQNVSNQNLQYYQNLPQQSIGKIVRPLPVTAAPAYTDCTDLYSQKEIRDILKTIGTDSKSDIMMMYVPRYSVAYYHESGALVINNLSQTNDTTEIMKDGSVKHVGSWHNKDIAPAGSFTYIVEDAQKRIENNMKN